MTAPAARTSARTSIFRCLSVACDWRTFPRTQSLRPALYKSNLTVIPLSVLSVHSRAFSNTPKTAVATKSRSSLMPVDQPPDSNATEYESTVDDIVKQVERFRILVTGRVGVGKSSLINCVSGINSARVEDQRVGEADIEQEFVSTQNQYFVLHDSKGFEPGDLSNFDIVFKFVEDRSKKHLLKDRIHALWFCTETPTTGGRVFETGDEKLLQFAHENKVPLMLVFTQYDRLVRTKEYQLRGTPDMVPATLHHQSAEVAQEVFKGTLKSVQVTMDRLRIPMPTCAKVSGL
ncbi:hypothetical protein V8E53_015131 [Lactarius tabidus]